MTDLTEDQVLKNEETALAEQALNDLRSQATTLGIEFHHALGATKLAAQIKEHIAEKELAADTPPPTPIDTPPVVAEKKPAAKPISKRLALKRRATALVRCQITCMNPHKKDWEGEIFTTGNKLTGTIKKYVPFNTEFHIPQMIFDMIDARKCQVFYTHTDPRTRQKTRKGKLVKEFSIGVLPHLTRVELDDLAQRQAMAAGGAN